jgi:hypothetical protein
LFIEYVSKIREGLHLVDRDVGVVADAALRRTARDVVRDAITLEGPRRPVVHADRDRDLERLLALAEHGDEVLIDFEGRADAAELLARQLERILAQVRRCRYVNRSHVVAPFLRANPLKILFRGEYTSGPSTVPP